MTPATETLKNLMAGKAALRAVGHCTRCFVAIATTIKVDPITGDTCPIIRGACGCVQCGHLMWFDGVKLADMTIAQRDATRANPGGIREKQACIARRISPND